MRNLIQRLERLERAVPRHGKRERVALSFVSATGPRRVVKAWTGTEASAIKRRADELPEAFADRAFEHFEPDAVGSCASVVIFD